MAVRDYAQYRLSGKRVWVAGHRGMVGSALVRQLGIVKLSRRARLAGLVSPASAMDLS
jgi:hypothetical protein